MLDSVTNPAVGTTANTATTTAERTGNRLSPGATNRRKRCSRETDDAVMEEWQPSSARRSSHDLRRIDGDRLTASPPPPPLLETTQSLTMDHDGGRSSQPPHHPNHPPSCFMKNEEDGGGEKSDDDDDGTLPIVASAVNTPSSLPRLSIPQQPLAVASPFDASKKMIVSPSLPPPPFSPPPAQGVPVATMAYPPLPSPAPESALHRSAGSGNFPGYMNCSSSFPVARQTPPPPPPPPLYHALGVPHWPSRPIAPPLSLQQQQNLFFQQQQYLQQQQQQQQQQSHGGMRLVSSSSAPPGLPRNFSMPHFGSPYASSRPTNNANNSMNGVGQPTPTPPPQRALARFNHMGPPSGGAGVPPPPPSGNNMHGGLHPFPRLPRVNSVNSPMMVSYQHQQQPLTTATTTRRPNSAPQPLTRTASTPLMTPLATLHAVVSPGRDDSPDSGTGSGDGSGGTAPTRRRPFFPSPPPPPPPASSLRQSTQTMMETPSSEEVALQANPPVSPIQLTGEGTDANHHMLYDSSHFLADLNLPSPRPLTLMDGDSVFAALPTPRDIHSNNNNNNNEINHIHLSPEEFDAVLAAFDTPGLDDGDGGISLF